MRKWIDLIETEIDPSRYYYHGTARTNLAFLPNDVAYFTPDYDEAREHALMDAEVDGGQAFVIKAKLHAKNIVKLEVIEMQDLHFLRSRVEELLSQGYDLAIHDSPNEVCVLDPKIIEVIDVVEAD